MRECHPSEDGLRWSDQAHRVVHTQGKGLALSLVEKHRASLGIEPNWTIDPVVLCPADLKNHEAVIWWDAEVYYARLYVRCTIPSQFLEWLVLHELCELAYWRTTGYIQQLIESVGYRGSLEKRQQTQEILKREGQRMRNQEIEWRLYGLTGRRRPDHLMENPFPLPGEPAPEEETRKEAVAVAVEEEEGEEE